MNFAENVAHARLLPNVVSGWLAHGVAIVVGFVMPRLINDSVGQAALGVWDLGWSLLTYLTVSGLGMAAAITHRVSRHASDADDALRRVTSTGFYCQLVLAIALGAAVGALFFALPVLAPEAVGRGVSQVQWVGVYLGLAIAVAMTGDVAQGILTGYHRTSWNEYLTIAGDIALALSMVAVVVAGGGITGLAMATLGVRLVCELSRFALAFRVCPSLCLSPRLWDRADALRLVRFAVKTSLGIVPDLVIHQGVRVLLALGAGPSALACYSRYQTVVKQIIRFMDRPARVIPPITRDLAGQGRLQEINDFRMRAAKATLMASLPMIVVFAVFGDYLILLWMGPDFVAPGLAYVLALMALINLDYGISSRVLAGLDAHGRIAILCFTSTVIVFVALYLALAPLDVTEAAWMAAIATAAGVSVPHFILSSLRLGTAPLAYFRAVYQNGLLANLVFLAGLLYGRALAEQGALGWASAVGLGSAGVLAVLYWRFGISPGSRASLSQSLRARRV